MARVVDGGFAYRVSEMINRAALLSTSQMLENSVPNSSVLVISLQQSEKSRECIVKIQDPELLHADRDPRTVMHCLVSCVFSDQLLQLAARVVYTCIS